MRQDRRDEAQAPLDSARAAYERIGATGWLARLDALLPAPQAAHR